MTAPLVAAWEVLACLGYGAMALRLLGLADALPGRERAPAAFALGVGLLGWLVFWPGMAGGLNPMALGAVLAVGTPGVLLLRPFRWSMPRPAPLTLLLAVGLALTLLLRLVEAAAPPSDGDTLAYHFALPKMYLAAGRVVFVPRWGDGATPMLVQMGTLPALALGGEWAASLWALATTCGLVWLGWALARRHLSRDWALALALLLATTPAVVYGSVAGQVEVRLALFFLLALLGLTGLRGAAGDWRWLVLAGLGCGFYAGAKYTGLLAMAGMGLVLAARRPGLGGLAAFALAGLLAGAQWYGWNWHSSGDPVFPKLWGILPIHPGLWTQAAQDHLPAGWNAVELPAPRTLGWYLAYPFVATLNGLPQWEAGRTGLGPWPLLALPFALGGAWAAGRRKLLGSPLWPVALVLLGCYTLWFFIPSSQRVRHLLPLLPALLVLLAAAATRLPTAFTRPLAAATAFALALQLAGSGVYAASFVKRLARGESDQAFLTRVADSYPMATWLNQRLGPGDKVLHMARTINFYLEVPYYLGHYSQQALIDLRPAADDEQRLLRQVLALGITHVVFEVEHGDEPLSRMMLRLVAAGCAVETAAVNFDSIASRTLPNPAPERRHFRLARLTPEAPGCTINGRA